MPGPRLCDRRKFITQTNLSDAFFVSASSEEHIDLQHAE